MSKLLNPYREIRELSAVGNLSGSEASELAEMVYKEPLAIKKNNGIFSIEFSNIVSMLENTGYRQLDENIFIRQNEFVSSFPNGKKQAEDRFAAIYPGFNKESSIIVNGKLNNLETALRDIDIFEDIFSKSVSYKKREGPNLGALVGLGLGIGGTGGLYVLFFINPVILGAAAVFSPFLGAAIHAVERKFRYESKVKGKACQLSENAEYYLYGESALFAIQSEFSMIQEDEHKLFFYSKVKDMPLDEFLEAYNEYGIRQASDYIGEYNEDVFFAVLREIRVKRNLDKYFRSLGGQGVKE